MFGDGYALFHWRFSSFARGNNGQEKGAHGFLLKNDPIETLVNVIYAVVDSVCYFHDRDSNAMVNGLLGGKRIKPTFILLSLQSEKEKLYC